MKPAWGINQPIDLNICHHRRILHRQIQSSHVPHRMPTWIAHELLLYPVKLFLGPPLQSFLPYLLLSIKKIRNFHRSEFEFGRRCIGELSSLGYGHSSHESNGQLLLLLLLAVVVVGRIIAEGDVNNSQQTRANWASTYRDHRTMDDFSVGRPDTRGPASVLHVRSPWNDAVWCFLLIMDRQNRVVWKSVCIYTYIYINYSLSFLWRKGEVH